MKEKKNLGATLGERVKSVIMVLEYILYHI